MSQYLWRYYLEDDLDSFGQLLATATFSGSHTRTTVHNNSTNAIAGSPGSGLATSPTLKSKSKGGRSSGSITVTRADLNSKDSHGLTLLHYMASSDAESASAFALELLRAPMLDLYVQDQENGWTSLHRALYFGNISIARALMARDIEDSVTTNAATHAGGLIKIKDKEGNSPFDVYSMTIGSRTLQHRLDRSTLSAFSARQHEDGSDDSTDEDEVGRRNLELLNAASALDGVELYLFGSNKNFNLGFSNEDDRHFPESPFIRRPQSLMKRFHKEHLSSLTENALIRLKELSNQDPQGEMPALVQFKPLHVFDVGLAKFHSAVLTTDSQANLYICGYGSAGRLGTGDTQTRFMFTSVSGGGLGSKKVIVVGLGQDHSLAITDEGEAYSWGSNTYGQLGYSLGKESLRQEEQPQLLPRQIIGPLKRENVVGCAASRIHSVLHTGDSLYIFGKNEGQLGLVDADARSLEMQIVPRRVAASLFSRPIAMVSAIDKATVCLLKNHEVWVFANYGYTKLQFDLDSLSFQLANNSFFGSRRGGLSDHIVKVCSGGSTICAMSSEGAVYTTSPKVERSASGTSSSNPAKLRGALAKPQELWSLRKSHMAARDVDVGQDGSVIVSTAAGSVWKREKRAKIKENSTPSGNVKDYKFSRVPGLTRAAAVRSNAFGAFAAIRKDCDVLKKQILVEPSNLWKDVFGLLPFRELASVENSDTEEPLPRFWAPKVDAYNPALIRRAVIQSKNIQTDVQQAITKLGDMSLSSCDIKLGTTFSDILIPCHSFLIAARSEPLRTALQKLSQGSSFAIPDLISADFDENEQATILFQDVDFLTLLNVIFYVYTDAVIDCWNFIGQAPKMASAYRQVRTEVMKVATQIELKGLGRAAGLMNEPSKQLHKDLDRAITRSGFFDFGDLEIKLNGDSRKVHAALVCQRCPFFDGLFHGRASGGWLKSRREGLTEAVTVDLDHIDASVFDFVLRHVYADVGIEIFEDAKATDLDAFLDLILDVLAVANELMLDRLAQICQTMLGRYANTRNICQLLNAVAPCSVTGFKNAALEYICLNLEGMLENGLLNELDEDLMKDLNEMVRENQLNTLPFAKSGREEEELFDRHPELPAILEKSRKTRIDSMALQSRLHEDEARSAKILRNVSKSPTLTVKSPFLAARGSSTDLMFDMEDDSGRLISSRKELIGPVLEAQKSQIRERKTLQPQTPPSREGNGTTRIYDEGTDAISHSSIGGSFPTLSLSSTAATPNNPQSPEQHPSKTTGLEPETSSPWRNATFNAEKLDMKQIMAQASAGRQSNISKAISNVSSGSNTKSIASVKLSQKERMRQQQQQRQQGTPAQQSTIMSLPPAQPPAPKQPKVSPWQTAPAPSKISLTEILKSSEDVIASQPASKPQRSHLPTSGQSEAGSVKDEHNLPSESTATPIAPPQAKRSVSQPLPSAAAANKALTPPLNPANTSITPRSINYSTTCAAAEPSIQLSMADILAQQQSEKQILKEATAKRSLVEIQEEQAFQEWWDQEVVATKARMEVEEAATARKERGGRGRGRGKARHKAEGGKGGPSDSQGSRRKSGEQQSDKKNTSAKTVAEQPTLAENTQARARNHSKVSRRRRRGGTSDLSSPLH